MQGHPDFHAAYDGEAQRRLIDGSVREARIRASQEIADQVTRDIALMFREQEAREAHAAELATLNAMVREYPPGAALNGVSQRTQSAFVRAQSQGNYSALEALQRELDRDREDEEHALLLMLVH